MSSCPGSPGGPAASFQPSARRDAFEALYDDTSAYVYGLACRILDDDLEAQDVVLDVYARAWGEAGRSEPFRGDPLGWLLRITRTVAVERLRASAPRSPLARPCAAADRRRDARTTGGGSRAHDALDELPAAERQLLELVYFGGLTTAEIARRVADSEDSVKSRLASALRRLRSVTSPSGSGMRP